MKMKNKLIIALKKFIYYHFNLFSFREKKAIELVNEITKNQTFFFKKSRFTVGIVKEKWHLHSSYKNVRTGNFILCN